MSLPVTIAILTNQCCFFVFMLHKETAMVSEKQYENSSKFDTHLYLNAKFKTNTESWSSWIFNHVPQKETKKILELGCRTGLIWLANRDHIPQNWNITLSDYSAGMLGETKLNLSRVKYNFSYEVIHAKDIGFEDNSFDVVMANLMLYHVENKKRPYQKSSEH